VTLGEEVRGIEVQVVALGTEVVVDDIEEDHQAPGVGRLDQDLEILRAPGSEAKRSRRRPGGRNLKVIPDDVYRKSRGYD
jgi:hypothetical protein